MNKKNPFYILWGNYYNPVLDNYREKMLGCYQDENNALRMADILRKSKPSCEYFVSTEYFCD